MQPSDLTADLQSLSAMAARVALRFCREHRLPWFEPDDVGQDLLVDLISRLHHYDPARCSFSGFAIVCFQHRISRLDARVRRETRFRHTTSFDQPLARTTTETLAETLSNEDGYSAWLGQSVNDVQAFEQECELDRVLGTLPESALRVCAILMRDEPNLASHAGFSRSTFYRRVHDLRCRVLAAGVEPSRATNQLDAG